MPFSPFTLWRFDGEQGKMARPGGGPEQHRTENETSSKRYAVLKKLNDVIEKVFLAAVWPLFFSYIVVIFVQVIARNYLEVTMIWLDEIARMFFLWTIMLGAAIALRRQSHYFVEVVPKRLWWANAALKMFAQAVVLVMIVVMLVPGWSFTVMSMYSVSSALEVPWAYIYVSMPLSAVAMLLFWTEITVDDIRRLRRGEWEA